MLNDGINCADPRPFRDPFAYAKGVFLVIYIFLKSTLHLPLRINITERNGKIYIYIYIITEMQIYRAGKAKKNSSKLNLILSDLTFVIDRVARKPNRS